MPLRDEVGSANPVAWRSALLFDSVCVTVEVRACHPQHLPHKRTGAPARSPCAPVRIAGGHGTVVRKVAGSVQQAADLTCALAFTGWHFMLLPSNWLLSSPGPASWSWAWTAIIARPALGSQESRSRLGLTSVSIPSLNEESPHPLPPLSCCWGDISRTAVEGRVIVG